MNKDFDWTGFKTGDFVVYCRNRNEIKQFLEECDKQGLKWVSGDPATNYIPEYPRACIKCDDLRLYHASRNFYEQAGKKIIDYNPEAPEPVAIYICKCCGGGIYAGDGYYDLPNGAWCEECVREQYRIAEEE